MTATVMAWGSAIAAAPIATAPNSSAPPSAGTVAESRTARAEDLRILEQQYVDVSPAFSETNRALARSRLAEMQRDADRLDPLGFYVAVMRIVALADNGHDSVMRGDHSWNPTVRLPVRLIWFPDGITVARAGPGFDDLLGATVLSMDDKTPDNLLVALRGIQGGTDDFRRWTVSGLLHSPEALHALGITRRADRVTLRLRLRDHREVVRTLVAVPIDALPPPPRPQEYWYPTPLPGEAERHWSTAAPPDRVPQYLREPQRWFRFEPLDGADAGYLQFRSNLDEEGESLGRFVGEVAGHLAAQPPRNIVVDLRFDTGGDITQNIDLMREVVRRVPGRIYVLTSHFTFSAGIAAAATLEHEGRDRVTIVGAPVGDRLHWWSEYQRVCLPGADLCVNRNEGYWDLEHGCRGNEHCYSDHFDINVPSLRPDIDAPIRAADWLAGTDPALDAVRADLARAASGR